MAFVAYQLLSRPHEPNPPTLIRAHVVPDRTSQVKISVDVPSCTGPSAYEVSIPVSEASQGAFVSIASEGPSSGTIERIQVWKDPAAAFEARPLGDQPQPAGTSEAELPRFRGKARLVVLSGSLEATSARDRTSCWVRVPELSLDGLDIPMPFSAAIQVNAETPLSTDGQLTASARRTYFLACNQEGGSDEGSQVRQPTSNECDVALVLGRSDFVAQHRDAVLTIALLIVGALAGMLIERFFLSSFGKSE